jgi:hypothetical protein
MLGGTDAGESSSDRREAVSISAGAVRRRYDRALKLHEGELPMTYLLQIYTSSQMADYEALSEEEQNAITAEYMAIAQTPGMLGGHQLQGPETATTVRVQDGSTLTTDGPFAETKEVIGGYYLFEADDLDAAIELASRIPAARMGGAIEVRPVVER